MKSAKTNTRRKSQPAKRSTKPKPPPPARKSGPSAALVSHLCGLTDPFCTHANGAKYPDDSSARTLAYQYHGRTTINSDANGAASMLFLPNYVYQPFVSGTVVAGVTTWGAMTTSGGTVSGVEKFRIVSMGIRLRRISPPLTSSGMVRVRTIAAELGTTFQSMDCASYARSESMDIALQDCSCVSIIFAHSSQMPQRFYLPADVTPDTGVINWTSPGFLPVTVAIDGAPASTGMLDVEFFVNYEFTFDEGSAMGLLATPAPPANTLLTAAASKVTSLASNFFTSTAHALGERLRDRAVKAIMSYTGVGRLATAAQYAITVD